MEDQYIVSGDTEQDVWAVINNDLADNDIQYYDVLIKQQDKEINLIIDIDLGGGFEGGYETTQLSTRLPAETKFRFAIHDEGFLDELGKFFGMQDVEIGYPELDKHVIIKTNDETSLKQIFLRDEVKQVFTELDDFDFGIHTYHVDHHGGKEPFLELNINSGLTDAEYLRKVYNAFYAVLCAITR